MWKVLIADDEPKIRRGLKTSIQRIRPDMTVVAEAEDGETALCLAVAEKPDILMIDVRMPFLNGLELIDRLGGVLTDCIIIVVSGHDEFEYAQRALQLKVFEYVLKPVPQEILAGVLDRAAEALSASRSQHRYFTWAKEQMERNLPFLREQFLRDWVRGRLSPLEIGEQAQFFGVEASAPAAMTVIHVADRAGAGAVFEEGERRLGLYAVRSAVEEAFQAFTPVCIFADERENIVVITCRPGGREWVEAAARLEKRVVPALCPALVVAQAAIPASPQGVQEAYEALCGEVAERSSHRALVSQAQGYIDAHFSDSALSLEEVAASAQISPGYLSRLLKLETGFSFVDYLTRVRITRAVQMMSDPAVKVYEAAEAVGYQSQHYFSRAFKRVFGRPPVEYRRGGA